MTAVLKQTLPSHLCRHLVTGEELLDHPEWGHCELVRGKVIPVTPPRYEHGIVTFSVAYHIGSFVKRKRLGKVTAADAGIYIARDPDTVRGPDVAFFSRARLKREPHPAGYSTVPPDLFVEVVSPGDRWSELDGKVDEYLAAGVRLVWVVDPTRRKVHVFARKRPPLVLQGKQSLDGEDVLPGFKLSLGKLFADLD
jgi:Uma2 family endonuclease